MTEAALQPAPPAPSSDRFLTREDLKREFGLCFSRGQLRKLEAEGKFVRRIRLSERCVRYLHSEVVRWIASRAAERDAANGDAS